MNLVTVYGPVTLIDIDEEDASIFAVCWVISFVVQEFNSALLSLFIKNKVPSVKLS